MLSGSSSPLFASWTQLRLFVAQSNPSLVLFALGVTGVTTHLTGVWLQNWDLNLFSSCTNIEYILMQATRHLNHTVPDGVGAELQYWWHYPVDISKGYRAGLVVIGKLHVLLVCSSQLVGSLTMLFREL